MHEAFLQDIRANPDDDVVRLIYADWLDEQDDLRGDFIRTQVRLTQSPPPAEFQVLCERERDLLRRQATGWIGPLMPRLQRWVFRRGFLDEIELRADLFLREGEELLDREPVRRARLRWATGVLGGLARSSVLARLADLDLSFSYLNDEAAKVLADSPALAGLQSLRLAHNCLRQRGAVALARSPTLSSLRLLDLTGNLLNSTARDILLARFGPAVRF